MAEWLGRGLQNLVQRFKSARDLQIYSALKRKQKAPFQQTELFVFVRRHRSFAVDSLGCLGVIRWKILSAEKRQDFFVNLRLPEICVIFLFLTE